MTMTRKDFEALAKIINTTVANVSGNASATPESMAYLLAEKIAQHGRVSNPRLNMARWRETVGYKLGGEVQPFHYAPDIQFPDEEYYR
jgi:hypothetical protein